MTLPPPLFQTINLNPSPHYLAPDTSEIRLLTTAILGNQCHCTLSSGMTSIAVAHKTIEEIWYVIEGQGEMWRKLGDTEEIIRLTPGTSLTIPISTHFQFRNIGPSDLCIIIVSMPPWPGADEAYEVPGRWSR